MDDLLSDHIKLNPPFTVTGTDFAGPFIIKDKKGRGSKPLKY